MDPKLLYAIPFFLSGLGILLLACFTWKRRQSRGGWYLFLTCLAASFWSATEGGLYLGFNAEINMLVTMIQYLGIVWVCPLTLFFILAQYGLDSWITPKIRTLIFTAPLLILLLVWTNPYHHLYYTSYYTITTDNFPMLGLEHGPLWWGYMSYNYLMLGVITLVLIRQVFLSVSFYRGQALAILVAVGAVWSANAVYVTGNSPLPNMDISPLAFALVTLSLVYGFFHYNLLDLLPVAKIEIFNSLEEPILVLDNKDRILDMNRAAESIFCCSIVKALGRKIGEVFSDQRQLLDGLDNSESAEISISGNDRESFYDLRFYSLKDRKRVVIGRLAVLRDITERKWMEHELRRLAVTDPLTGAANRRRLFELAEAEFSRSRRYQRHMSVVLIDIDHFKKINDTHGHDAGDEVLKLLVNVCLKKLRSGDIFGRLGGEEFVAVLTDTEVEKALLVAERLRLEIDGLNFIKDGSLLHFTVSMGLSRIEPDDSDFRALLKRADQALYRAKTDGRNCVR